MLKRRIEKSLPGRKFFRLKRNVRPPHTLRRFTGPCGDEATTDTSSGSGETCVSAIGICSDSDDPCKMTYPPSRNVELKFLRTIIPVQTLYDE